MLYQKSILLVVIFNLLKLMQDTLLLVAIKYFLSDVYECVEDHALRR